MDKTFEINENQVEISDGTISNSNKNGIQYNTTITAEIDGTHTSNITHPAITRGNQSKELPQLNIPNKSTSFNWQETELFDRNNLDHYQTWIEASLKLVSDQLQQTNQPFSGITPKEKAKEFEGLDLDTPLLDANQSLDELQKLYLKDAIYFNDNQYMAHLNCPIVIPAIAAELILSSINSSLDTWDQSAGGTLIEQSLIDWCCKKIGFDESADGIFTSGGTQSNFMAMLLARDHAEPQHCTKTLGLSQDAHKYRIYTSAISHFSVQKSAALLGLGYDAVVSVDVNHQFQMDVLDLQRKIKRDTQQGLMPIAVVATAGTTDFGSIDPIFSIREVAELNDLWLHVDAAYGCGLLVSKQHRHALEGIELADSVTVDFHKSFFQPVSCSGFFVKEASHLSVVTHHAEYLNPLSQSQEGTPNLVNKSIQTTRRFDSLKLWLTLRAMGPNQIGTMFDQLIELANQAARLSDTYDHFEVLHSAGSRPQLSTLIFRVVPMRLDPSIDAEITKDDALLDFENDFNEEIRKTLFKQGLAVVASTKFQGKKYLKFTLLNPTTHIDHIRNVFDLITEAAQSLLSHSLPNAEDDAGC